MMRRDEVALHYAELKANGKHYRILSTNFPKLIPGHPSSDVFGFFGLGSGEFRESMIPNLPFVRVVEEKNFDESLKRWSKHPDYAGFIDALPQQRPIVLLQCAENDPDGISMYDLPINWSVYTQLGVASHALQILGALSRIHCAYPKLEQQQARLKRYREYVKMMA